MAHSALFCSMRKDTNVAPLHGHSVQIEWVKVKPVHGPVKRELVQVKTTYVVRDNWIMARVNGS